MFGIILSGMATITLSGFRCDRCGHEWFPRDKTQEPVVCPKCKSPYWNRPRQGEETFKTELGEPSSNETENRGNKERK
jgi:DNA-directed RNA polymerase subunit RPC12/RpoP